MKLLLAEDEKTLSEVLFDRVWGQESEESRNVWVYISFLRKKLKALHADVGICAVGKDAYQLEDLNV